MNKLTIFSILIGFCSCCENEHIPYGTYVSNVIERDTLFIFREKSYQDSIIWSKYQSSYPLFGNYKRHIFHNDTLKIIRGFWAYDVGFKSILLYDWIKFPQENWYLCYEISSGREKRPSISLPFGYSYWCYEIKNIWLGGTYDPPQKYVKIK